MLLCLPDLRINQVRKLFISETKFTKKKPCWSIKWRFETNTTAQDNIIEQYYALQARHQATRVPAMTSPKMGVTDFCF